MVRIMQFENAINQVKHKGIVLNIINDKEPVILKHNKGEFKAISEDELLKTFNDNYDGADVIDVEDIRKELTKVEIADYRK